MISSLKKLPKGKTEEFREYEPDSIPNSNFLWDKVGS